MTLKIMRNLLNHFLISALLLVAMPFGASANEIDAAALLKKGNEAYAKNQFREAALAYQQILDAGYESATVYFNLGNAYYKLTEIPDAILNYEKALKLNPGDSDIQLNLQLANLKITDRIEGVPEFFLSRWWREFVSFIPLGTLSVFIVICSIAGFVSMIIYLYLTTVWPKKLAFYSGVALLSLALIFVIMAAVQSNYLNNGKEGIVFSGAADVKSGPDDKQKTLFVVHEGTKVNIQEQNDNWIKITLANGNGGWIKLTDIKKI